MNIDDRLENDPQTELAATLTDPNSLSLGSILLPHAQTLVGAVDPLDVPGEQKHDWVYNTLLELVPLLQSSVKETRVIPPDVIATILDKVINVALSWLESII